MTRRLHQRGFSLIEMVMVMLTLGIIAMIAVPRMSRAATDAQASAMVANIRVLQGAIEVYAAEHNNRDPARDSNGTVSTDGARFVARLLNSTNEQGSLGGLFGPYVLRIPRNPGNDLNTIRIDGVAAGAGLAGWRFDSARQRLRPDHMDEATADAIILSRVSRKGLTAGEIDLLK